MTRTNKIEVRLTEEEKQKIREISERKGLDMSNYARMKMLEPVQMVTQ